MAHIRTMDEIEARNTARQRFNMLLLTVFGSAGLLMAAIGIYGVMSYSVQQRTQELGVRMALGAQASNLRNMVIRQGMALTLIGVALGAGGAFWLTRFLASFLFGVKTVDPIAFVATPVLLCVVALLDLDSGETRDSRGSNDCPSLRVKRKAHIFEKWSQFSVAAKAPTYSEDASCYRTSMCASYRRH